MRLAARETFIEAPAKGVAGLGSCWYVSPKSNDMEALFGTQTRSDINDRRWRRWSRDNGKTWGDAEEIDFIRKSPDGTHRIGYHPGVIDPFTGRLIRLSNRVCLPTDNPGEGAARYTIWYEVSVDGGKSYGDARQISEDGSQADRPFEPIHVGRNGYMLGDQTCIPIFLADGTVLAPFQMAEMNKDGSLYQPYDTPFYHSRVAIGRWRGETETSIKWELSEPARLEPKHTTRGAFEPTIARVPDGRILMVLRASNMKKPELPGRRWYCVSHDNGRSWGEVNPWTYGSGESFFSPSSCSQLLWHSTQRLLWLGNISPENPDGNLPRRPFCMGEVDQKSLLLKKDTVLVVDDLQPGDNYRMNLSNFYAYEDRETREVVICMPRWFARAAEKSDWTTDSYRYRIEL